MAWNTNTPRQYKGYGTRFQGCIVRVKADEPCAVEASTVADKTNIGVIKEPNMRDGEVVSVASTSGDRVMFCSKQAIKEGDLVTCSTTDAGMAEKTTVVANAIGVATQSISANKDGIYFEGTLL